ncbi:MAG: nitrate reductase subunit alpha [Thermoprotei archaeon]
MTRSQLRHIPQYFSRATPNAEGWSAVTPRDREWEETYRLRWQHDKIVRSTHGVNCTGSCSWKIYVKDGIVTWETQQTDYPTNGPNLPEYEPRGCPRGASFSWYLYSPLRVKYPYIRGELWRLWKEALTLSGGDEVKAWESIVEDPARSARYKTARGKGGFIRIRHDEVFRLISAALIYTIRKYGPDRVFGFTPIPAMSMVSYAAGTRFLSLLGGVSISFYDWYCDLPPASPQVWGEQTDVPESADWFNSSYIVMWGSNLPITRTPDAHFMVEARYRGTKVVAISPDYTDNVKFGDVWIHPKPGTDGALAMSMVHVVLKEFFVDRQVDYFTKYVSAYTDLPFLVVLRADGEGYVSEGFLTAAHIGLRVENPEWKPMVWDAITGRPVAPNGSIGFRWGREQGKWNLELISEGEQVQPTLSLLGCQDDVLPVRFPVFGDDGSRSVLTRGVPAKKISGTKGELYVTTVLDLLLAHLGVSRGLPGDYPSGYEDPKPYTPAWQEKITGVDRNIAIRVAREFAKNAELTRGRSMIIMGSGINHWYHGDQIYRAILSLVMLTGCQGVNGGGWAHYVGQEKVRPLEGWSTLAFALDWVRPARQQNGTSFFYFAADQWRYEEESADRLLSPLAKRFLGLHYADYNVLAVRLGWLPFYPQFDANPLNLAFEGDGGRGSNPEGVPRRVSAALKDGRLHFAVEDPDNPLNAPKIMFVWRANILSASGKGHEYFLKHMLGTTNSVMGRDVGRPKFVVWREQALTGKLDLLVDINFRMDGTALYSDVVLPAATWYEKHDISSTDLHPFIHPFNPAVDPLWESRSDWDTFAGLAKTFSEMASKHFSGKVLDVVAVPLLHDTPDEIAQPGGRVHDWSELGVEPIPGKTTQKLVVVERDYPHVYDMMTSLGPLVLSQGVGAKGVVFLPKEEYNELAAELGRVSEGVAAGCVRIGSGKAAAEVILTLSGATNGSIAIKGWEALEKRCGVGLKDLAEGHADVRVRFDDLVDQPRRAITTPVWSGIEKGGRQYTAFAVNVERKVPWRTFTGRQHFYIDHEVYWEFGESLPTFRPPINFEPFLEGELPPTAGGNFIRARWITPHNKWSIHTTYSDNLRMLTLFRGGPTVWLNDQDAEAAGIRDNDWVEVYSRNGVMVARAVVSHRIPRGAAFSYHAQDRTVNVPASSMTHARGGLHNSVTRIRVKPTHMVGGYAQLSYAFNYWGPVGSQRDTVVFIKRMNEVNWLED